MELRLNERHIIALNLLLVAVLAYFAALAIRDLITLGRGSGEAPVARTRDKAADNSSANRTRAAYQAIVERDIFNLEAPPAPPPEVVVEDLHLTLIGVSQTTKGKPYAIIADQRGEQSVYRVGETIPGSGKLLQVEKDRAIVEHGGKQVAIEIPKDDTGGGPRRLRSIEPPILDTNPTPAEASSQDETRHRKMRRHHFE